MAALSLLRIVVSRILFLVVSRSRYFISSCKFDFKALEALRKEVLLIGIRSLEYCELYNIKC